MKPRRSPRSAATPTPSSAAVPSPPPSASPTLQASTGEGGRTAAIELSTANRPFIFDSVLGELQALGHPVRLVVHPIFEVERDAEGKATRFGPATREASPGHERESFIHVHVPLIRDGAAKAALAENLQALLNEVRLATDDWRAMRARLRGAITDFRLDHPPLPATTVEETIAFLQWLDEGNFVFLGMREYSYGGRRRAGRADGGERPRTAARSDRDGAAARHRAMVMSPEIRAFLTAPDPLIVTKANVQTRVHRRDYMDYVGVKIFEDGKVKGELRIVGLFTSTAFTQSAQQIPLIRRKVADILKRAGFDPLSHSGKALLNILENYPRTELFQAETDELFDSAMAILQLEERPRVRALPRRDRFDRFVSVLVFVPRDRYTSDLRERIGDALAEIYDGRVSAFFPDFSLTHLTRVQFIIGRNPGKGPDPSQSEIEARIRAIVRTFDDDLAETLNAAHPVERAAASARTMPAPSAPTIAPASPPRTRSRHRDRRAAGAGRHRGALLPAARHAGHAGGDELSPSRRSDPALAARSAAGESRLLGRQRAHLLRRAHGPAASLSPRHDAGAGGRRGLRPRGRRPPA